MTTLDADDATQGGRERSSDVVNPSSGSKAAQEVDMVFGLEFHSSNDLGWKQYCWHIQKQTLVRLSK